MENPIKIHDLGGPPLFLETPIFVQFAIKIIDLVNLNIFIFCKKISHPLGFQTPGEEVFGPQKHT